MKFFKNWTSSFILFHFFIFATTTTARANNILYIGDSHTVGPFGKELDRLLRFNGHVTNTYGAAGSIGNWWLTGKSTHAGYFQKLEDGFEILKKKSRLPTMDLLLKKFPDIVVVSLGTNYSNYSDPSFIKDDIRKLMAKIINAGAQCYWIGPPDSRLLRKKIKAINKEIKPIIQDNCYFYDSSKISYYPEKGGDGIHFWSPPLDKIAAAWANDVFVDFEYFLFLLYTFQRN
ncbi:MAG: SGNH/GDSL hydrolase family protein [Bacteriovoracaceae bacterium]|nr:SGNH/GDSL hydrolase family protein [Bacteriovoracaceae bacterium]